MRLCAGRDGMIFYGDDEMDGDEKRQGCRGLGWNS